MTRSEGRTVNDVAQLKEYVAVHAKGQHLDGFETLLDRVRTDDERGDGSWVTEWCRAGTVLQLRGLELDAARHFAMARFPYVNGPGRQEALDRCVRSVERWAATQPDVERVDVELDGGRFRSWACGLSSTAPKPLVVVMGGIVTIKEQWAPMLTNLKRLGMAAIVTELPGTGENTLTYGPDSSRMLSALLDAVADRADVVHTYPIAMSFSGHLALRCALTDRRIRGVVTVGAPTSRFFTDADWQRGLPRITVDTLAHLTRTDPSDLPGSLAGWALTGDELATLDIPVSYAASLRDEIIPADDWHLLRDRVRHLDLVELDDVHGSPDHVAETQLWTVRSLLRARKARGPASAAISLLLGLRRAKRRRADRHR